MKARVTTEFTDKYTGELRKVGDILDLDIRRINEILAVGGFLQLIEPSPEDQSKSEDAGEQEEPPKQTGGRRKTDKN